LVDDVQAYGAGTVYRLAKIYNHCATSIGKAREDAQLIDVRVEDSVDEADTRALVRILVGKLNVNLPEAALEGCWVR
jgi:hypothetical protein